MASSSRGGSNARHTAISRCASSRPNLHPDHDTIATFRRTNRPAFKAAFLQVLLLARGRGLLRLDTVPIDGTKIDANASKIRSVRYDRACELRRKLATDIAQLTAQAEAADAEAVASILTLVGNR